jgi:hypothetical protein
MVSKNEEGKLKNDSIRSESNMLMDLKKKESVFLSDGCEILGSHRILLQWPPGIFILLEP